MMNACGRVAGCRASGRTVITDREENQRDNVFCSDNRSDSSILKDLKKCILVVVRAKR